MTLESHDQISTKEEVSTVTRPRLLLADDSVTIRKVVELTFADEGIDVSTVSDAQSAMAKFVEIQPDIVLVDAGLPGTNGYQICEMIKQDEATKHIPVLLLIGSFEPFDQSEADRVGSDGVLTKPFSSIRDLVSRVTELLHTENTAVSDAPSVEGSSRANVPGEDTIDIDNLYQNSFAQTMEIEEFDTVEDLFDDQDPDDDLIEESRPTETGDEETLFTEEPAQEEAATVKEFDWSPAAILEETTPPEVAERPKTRFSFADLESDSDEPPSSGFDTIGSDSTESREDELANDDQAPSDLPDLSPEFIDRVAHRVAEIMSDSNVREIAKEAVPRIAEKLIREALDPEKKA